MVLTLLYKNENGKKSHWTLSSFSFPPLSRDVGFYSNSRYKIVALKNAWNHLNHPEWWVDLFFLTTLRPAKTHTKKLSFALGILGHPSHSHTIPLDKGSCMCHWQESVRVGSIPSIWVFILQTPGAIPCFVELHPVSGQHACLREHVMQPGANCARSVKL